MGLATPSLETRNLTIRFGGHVAVDAVFLRVPPGRADRHRRPERRGQDDLFQSDVRPAARDRRRRSRATAPTSPARARRSARGSGIGRAFQLTNLFPGLSVIENVRLATQARGRRSLRDDAAVDGAPRSDRPRRGRARRGRPERAARCSASPRSRTATSASSRSR